VSGFGIQNEELCPQRILYRQMFRALELALVIRDARACEQRPNALKPKFPRLADAIAAGDAFPMRV
jgi:hypothetical protein